MEPVENIMQRPPVIIGYGIKSQEGALRTAGAERVFVHPKQLATLIDGAGIALRADDTLLMVQPRLMTLADQLTLWRACCGKLLFQVVGHKAFPLATERLLREWRNLKPKVSQAEIVQLTGRPRVTDYTPQQADAIIKLWHEVPKRKPTEVKALAETILGVEPDTLKAHWVRDLVIKFVGTAKRDKPDGWSGVVSDNK